jgi:hypothetical protein
LEQQTSQHEQEKDKIKGKLTESVRLLQHMKQLKQQADTHNESQQRELEKVKEEMQAREKAEKERAYRERADRERAERERQVLAQ